MTSRRRLVVAVAGIATVAVLSSSYLLGDPEIPKKGKLSLPSVDRQPAQPDADPDPEAAFARSRFARGGMLIYEALEGNPYFALQAQVKLDPAPRRPRDYLLMVSVTAGMAGAPLNAAREMAEALAKSAGPQDRVNVWVLSTPDEKFSRSLTRGFVEPLGQDKKLVKKLQNAFQDLAKKEYPVGDSDLKWGLERAGAGFDLEGHQRILVYFGDGLSLHNPLTSAERATLGKRLAEKRIVFYPVPLGKNIDASNIHGLATATGGAPLRVRIFDETVEQAVKRAQETFAAPILYPDRFKLPAEVVEHYPTVLPPLRADSPTLIVGRLKKAKEVTLQVTGKVDGVPGQVTRTMTTPVPAPELDNFFLISMVAQWKNAASEHALIRADRALVFAFEKARLECQELLTAAQIAVQKNELDAAARLYEQARQLSPLEPEVRVGLRVVADLRSGKITRKMIEKEVEKARQGAVGINKNGVARLTAQQLAQLEPKDVPPVGKGAPGLPDAAPEDLLREHKARQIVEEQKIKQTVQAALDQARRDMNAGNPEAAHRRLRDALLLVETQAADLDARVRDELVGQLENQLRTVAVRGKDMLERQAEEQQRKAQAQESLDRFAQRQAEQERIEARVRYFKNLMNLARYEETAMREIMNAMVDVQRQAKIGGTPVPQAAQAIYQQSQARFNIQKLADLKTLRELRFLQIMMDVEKTFVPFPDEPPIHFPSLAYWKALTKIRKDKYEVQTLPDDPKGRAEAMEIQTLLSQEIDLKDFPEKAKLKEVLEFLSTFLTKMNKDHKDVPIVLDVNAFKAENEDVTSEGLLGEDVEIPAFPKRMAASTLLRLALGRLPTRNATYIIRRNFIEVTTNDRQYFDEKVLRVYPVGELVLPIKGQQLLGAAGGGGMIGGVGFNGINGGVGGGAFAGGIGGFGGGGFNFGGGGFNFGGGFGGGGFNFGGGGFNFGGGGFNFGGGGGFNFGGGGFNFGGGGGFNFGGGGFNFGGGGFNFGGGGFNFGGGGFNFGGGFGGGGFNFGGGGFNQGGQFPGGFNGNLGFIGASQAMPLIITITRIVAPGEWFKSPAQLAAEQFAGGGFMGVGFMGGFGGGFMGGFGGFMGGFMGGGFMGGGFMGGGFMGPGFMGAGFMGAGFMGAGPPIPVAQGGPADITKSNSIEFFAPALALIVRAPSRVHYKSESAIIGPKKTPVDKGAGNDPPRPRDPLAQADVPGGGAKKLAQFANAADRNDLPARGGQKVQVAAGNGRKDPAAGGKGGAAVKEEDIDPKTIWEDALAKSGGDPGLVIATADFLFEHEKYEHAAEFLKANLRLGIVVRPWVYEALAVAMEAAGGYPADEIRRARLSGIALDPKGADGFLKAAQAMAEHKEWDRALAFCRQAAQLEPNVTRPYTEALAYAKLGKDAGGMEWAAGKLLGQDWPGDNEGLHSRAQAELDALAGTLAAQKRQAEADRLRATLQRLSERDVVVKISWQPGDSGPADFELEVKEPGGSICSSQLRMTPGGGALIGNTLKHLGRVSYVNAQAYSGLYEVTIRRVWGRPLGGNVRLEVITHQGTAKEERRLETVRIDQKLSFKITLASGRRTEPAAVPPLAAQEPETTVVAPESSVRILSKLRDIADADQTGSDRGFQGGFSAPLSARPQLVDSSSSRQSDRLTYQEALASQSGVNLTARATVSADQQSIHLSLTPSFHTRTGPATPVIDLPLIPGGSR
jgi:tetratricopeptide (TPR) repeat protein